MKSDQVANELFNLTSAFKSITASRASIPGIDPYFKHFMESLMMQTYCNEEQQKRECYAAVNIANASNSDHFGKIAIHCRLIPWQTRSSV